MNQAVIDRLVEMAHSPIYNYIVPGLESWLIMDNGDAGKIRMFHFEGPMQSMLTHVLEPFVGGKVIPTMKTESWMFQRGE